MRSCRTSSALLIAFSGLVTACGDPSGESGGSNPNVPATASAEEVVDGYLQALQERNTPDAVALTIDGYDWRDQWSYDPPTITDVQTGSPSPWDLEGPAQEEYEEGVTVPASVIVQGAEEITDGPAALTFILWRGRVNDRWLIAGIEYTNSTGAGIVS